MVIVTSNIADFAVTIGCLAFKYPDPTIPIAAYSVVSCALLRLALKIADAEMPPFTFERYI
jgi:hypothetical protein